MSSNNNDNVPNSTGFVQVLGPRLNTEFVNYYEKTPLGGVKFDDGKTRWDLLPWDALEEIAKVMTFGAKKYGDRNWEKGIAYGRLIRAAVGHITSWAMRRDVDSETGLSHLAHAGCCVLFLLAYILRGVGEDNRPVIKQATKQGQWEKVTIVNGKLTYYNHFR